MGEAGGQGKATARGMAGTLRDNIEMVEQRRRDERHDASASVRVADAITRFIGSMTFVGVHAALYGGWILVNSGLVPGVHPFDPSFVMLATEASVEAIFLSTFVLIAQNRLAAADERRADLDLHISLLTEHELTRLAVLVERIAARLEIDNDDPDYAEVKRDIDPKQVLEGIEAARSSG